MITRDGRGLLKDKLISNVGYKIGSGGDSTNPNASDLDVPIDSSIQTSGLVVNSSGESTIDYKISINGSSYQGHTIKEIGIFVNDQDDNLGTNKLICRVNYDGIGPLTSTDEVEFIITVEVD